tara:strand:- start:4941 stop:5588 length:648 start_codon:yes stop_codon:yes gene_type:complete
MKTDLLDIRNTDCMKLMAEYPDNHFDLAVVDPPYGIGISGQKLNKKGKKSDRKHHVEKGWDTSSPKKEYFDELHRVSKNCIIWGANYMLHGLSEAHKGWIIWDKAQHGLTMSDCEIAYSTFDKPTRIWTQNRVILLQEGNTIHPTQKPVKLYDWIFANYAEKGMRILDTHMGSGSIAIASHYAGMNLTACELDEDYYEEACCRIERETAQQTLFA